MLLSPQRFAAHFLRGVGFFPVSLCPTGRHRALHFSTYDHSDGITIHCHHGVDVLLRWIRSGILHCTSLGTLAIHVRNVRLPPGTGSFNH